MKALFQAAPHHAFTSCCDRLRLSVAAIQLGTATDCGWLGYSSASLIIENSSAPVIELAGGAVAVGKMTAFETAPSESVMGEAHAAEREDRGDGCNIDKDLHGCCNSTEGWLQQPITAMLPSKRPGTASF